LLNAKVAFKLLRKLGCENVIHAKDGIEGKRDTASDFNLTALAACKKEKFDLCLMGIANYYEAS